jgi:dephospho-CoA kinase
VGDSEPVVIGLAGGIGAGKSEVARAFAALGCVVADSDKAAREALDREDVKARLVAWWGRDILDALGQVDRSKVAQIVFEDDDAREKLEALVHPIVRLSRKELRAMAKAADSPAAILDSPLLFEAGLENECDAVVFVEAPREIRLERVRKSRGWDEKELLRREKKQLPLDAKRERSDYCIVNGAQTDTGQLQTQAEHILEQILTHK